MAWSEALGVKPAVDHRCTSSADFFLHEGVLQSAADALDLSTENWPIHIPGLTQGCRSGLRWHA